MLQKFDERNRNLIININGQLVHRDKAGISPFDSAVQGGDAVWEGLRLYNGRIFKLHEHFDRLERSARALSIVDIPPREKIVEELKRTLAANKMRGGVHIRLTLTRGVKITSGMDPRLNQSGATVIEICAVEKIRCVETDLSPVDVYGADEMFCTGTMGELAGVVKIDNRDIGDGKIGPMTKRLSELYAVRTAAEGVQIVD